MLAGSAQGTMRGASVDFKLPEFIAHFHSKYSERCVAKPNALNISDLYKAPGVFFGNTETGTNSVTDM